MNQPRPQSSFKEIGKRSAGGEVLHEHLLVIMTILRKNRYH